jgi:hypothetical protein
MPYDTGKPDGLIRQSASYKIEGQVIIDKAKGSAEEFTH